MQNKGLLIGFLAKKRHGKDTIADYLVKKYDFVKESFASPIKESLKKMFLFSEDQVNGDLKEVEDPRWKVSPRKVMQFFGTEIARNQFSQIMPHIGNNFWLQHFIFRMEDLVKSGKNMIALSDVRFPNEVALVKEQGGIVIKIVRPGQTIKDEHESERLIDEIKDYDYLIVNDGTLEDLYKKVDDLLMEICDKKND